MMQMKSSAKAGEQSHRQNRVVVATKRREEVEKGWTGLLGPAGADY